MLDFIGMVITAALMVLFVNVLTTFMDITRVAKIALAAVIGVWIGLAAAVAGAGWLPIARPGGAGAVAAEGRGRAPHHRNHGLESVWRCRPRAGNCLRHHLVEGFGL